MASSGLVLTGCDKRVSKTPELKPIPENSPVHDFKKTPKRTIQTINWYGESSESVCETKITEVRFCNKSGNHYLKFDPIPLFHYKMKSPISCSIFFQIEPLTNEQPLEIPITQNMLEFSKCSQYFKDGWTVDFTHDSSTITHANLRKSY